MSPHTQGFPDYYETGIAVCSGERVKSMLGGRHRLDRSERNMKRILSARGHTRPKFAELTQENVDLNEKLCEVLQKYVFFFSSSVFLLGLWRILKT